MNIIRTHLNTLLILLAVVAVGYFLLRRPTEKVTVSSATGPTQGGATSAIAPDSAAAERTLDIVTLLPRDAIPAIDRPRFYSTAEADAEYAPDELVLGVSLGGESRAYSTALLSSHEIVNDTVGGRKIAVTW